MLPGPARSQSAMGRTSSHSQFPALLCLSVWALHLAVLVDLAASLALDSPLCPHLAIVVGLCCSVSPYLPLGATFAEHSLRVLDRQESGHASRSALHTLRPIYSSPSAHAALPASTPRLPLLLSLSRTCCACLWGSCSKALSHKTFEKF